MKLRERLLNEIKKKELNLQIEMKQNRQNIRKKSK